MTTSERDPSSSRGALPVAAAERAREEMLTRRVELPRLLLPAASAWIATWFVLVAAMFATRPILPIDESRYVGVAWEMWHRGDFILPTLNGHPYSDKPPLLFWTIQLGWLLFGVNEWWPRLVPALFGLANLALVARLSRVFWGERTESAAVAPVLLLGLLGWTFFTTTLTFDMALVFGILLSLLGLYSARQRWSAGAWLRFTLGIGLALLAKGPVALLFVLPVLVLARWWSPRRTPGAWLRWYATALAGFLAGGGLVLAWAIPAAFRGGEAYRDAIFLHQTTHRLVQAVAHPQPWWWYLAVLPLMTFPFSFLPESWARLRRLSLEDPAVRFCVSWALPAFVLLCAISSKQPHYLLGLLPALALLLSRALSGWDQRVPLSRLALPLLGLGIFGLVLFAAPALAGRYKLPHWFAGMAPTAGFVVLAAAVAGLALRRQSVPRLAILAHLSALIFLAVHVGVISVVADQYDVRPAAQYLRFLESEGAEIAHVGPYHDQFHFEGRLTSSFTRLPDVVAAKSWLEARPKGCAIAYYSAGRQPAELGSPDYAQPFRGRLLGIWGPRPSAAPSRALEPAAADPSR